MRCGEVRFETEGIGDFILQRPDGRPTYNFAVVVDDALMEITHVVRGEEHISNTPGRFSCMRPWALRPLSSPMLPSS